MNFHFNAINLADFFQKLCKIGFLHQTADLSHEFEILKRFGTGSIIHHAYPQGLHISTSAMQLSQELRYSFALNNIFFEILYVKAGYLEIYNSRTQTMLRVLPGEYLLLQAESFSGWNRMPPHESLHFVTLKMKKNYVEHLAKNDLILPPEALRSAPLLPQKAPIPLQELLEKFFQSPYESLALKRLRLEGLFREVLAEFIFSSITQNAYQQLPEKPPHLNSDDASRLFFARQLIGERMSSPPSINELAKLSCLNTCKLKSGFKALFGCTIYGYLRQLRMEKAKLLLQDTQVSVHDIALQLGYANGSALSPIFKAHWGVTPMEYRQKQRLSRISTLSSDAAHL